MMTLTGQDDDSRVSREHDDESLEMWNWCLQQLITGIHMIRYTLAILKWSTVYSSV